MRTLARFAPGRALAAMLCALLTACLSSAAPAQAAAPRSTSAPAQASAPATKPHASAPATAPRIEPVTVTDPRDYYDEKILSIVKQHLVADGNFRMSVVPMSQELVIAGQYRTWTEKRFSTDKMVEQIRTDAPMYRDSLHAMLTVVFVGDMFSKGRSQFEVPDDIAEYIFLENDRGQAIRCTRAVVPLMRMAGPFTKQVNVQLEFSNLAAAPKDFFKTKTLKFVVGGIGFRNNAVVYGYPLSDLFGDAPDPLRALFRASGVWRS